MLRLCHTPSFDISEAECERGSYKRLSNKDRHRFGAHLSVPSRSLGEFGLASASQKYLFVTLVLPGSIADLAGLKANDRVVAVNGVRGSDKLMIEELRRAHLKNPNKHDTWKFLVIDEEGFQNSLKRCTNVLELRLNVQQIYYNVEKSVRELEKARDSLKKTHDHSMTINTFRKFGSDNFNITENTKSYEGQELGGSLANIFYARQRSHTL